MSNNVISISESDYNRLKGLSDYGNKTEKKVISNNKKTIMEVNDHEFIVISGARENNLQNISVNIPKNKMTVITGLSGSGKSSLAFDTIYAESRRRFMDSISSTGRQFFKQFEKPAVDQITNLPPAIAVEQKSISRNTRSTVGTITDISDLLRLLFARIGVRHCPECGRAVEPKTVPEIITLLSNLHSEISFNIVSLKKNDILFNFTVPEYKDIREYITSLKRVVEEILETESGAFKIITEDSDEFILHTRNHCYYCGISFFELTPSSFSSNNPESMCPDCDGLGTQMKISPELIVSEPEKSILDSASAWWGDLRKFMKKPTGNWFKGEVIALANSMKVDLEKPWSKLPSAFREKALFGSDGEEVQLAYYGSRGRSGDISRPVEGAVNHIKRLFRDSHGKKTADYLKQFMDEKECGTCMGEQLSAQARYVTVGNKRFPEVMSLSIEELKNWAENLNKQLSEKDATISNEITGNLIHKTASLINVGLYYLTLKRPLPTLSGGEAQRLRLASQLGCGLSNLLYVIDEPSIGLHQSDHSKLIKTMKELRDAGNTLVIVEHDKETMLEADFLIDIGPGAGINGGNLIAQGYPEEVIKNKNSITGRYLQKTFSSDKKNTIQQKAFNNWLKLYGASKNNLKDVDVSFPIGAFICITGKSGSGKSSLITHTLAPVLTYYCSHNILLKNDYKKIEGIENIDNVISITQEPIGRTPRSNPATYTGVFDEIRNIFASTDQAKNREYSINRFSFNSKEGQCESCSGEGRKKIEMNFMPDVWITCSECGGKRFNNDTLEITYKDKTIADVLEMDIDEACRLFAEDNKAFGILNTLQDVGLGYLKLGQSALTLSGGEGQRVKLAKELSKSRAGRTVYILDEPTTGLHFQDIEHLLNLLHRIVDAGNIVIVIEHNADLIRNADWIIDLGPEGGDKGGYIIAEGTPEEVKECKNSITGNII
ncbi:MAG: excinuclease ABC subunit UvrA [Spirochaetes bacterium]|nr:excinuclease ABC subunit UvrA [Spirochaetota bacterium]